MTPEIITLIATYAIKYGIPAAQKLIAIYKNAGAIVSIEEWNEVFRLSEKSEEQYVAGK